MAWRDATQTFGELRNQEVLPADAADAGEGGARSIGARLGRYVLLYRLGSGGMGVVFAAYDPELDRKVALKLVRPETDSPAARDALRGEAQAMARLSHPNIVAVHDVGSEGEEVFLAMELIEGATLSEWLQIGERSWRDVLHVFLQAGRGLAAAHAAGVVHQDFSPRNVLVTAAQEARITDFGLARAQGPSGFNTLGNTPGETVRGTPAYLAPERLLGVAVDPRSDQFSFCAALYKALCGTLPFPATSPDLYLERVGRKDFAPPQGGRRVPRRLLALLRRGLEARPENRFGTMPELLDRLARASQRPRRLLAAVFAVALLASAAAAVVFREARSAAPDRLSGVWNPAQRQQVRQAFLKADPASGAVAAAQAESEIDAYVARWRAIDEDSHWMAMRTGEALLRDRQRLCLDARRAELRALLIRLGTWETPALEPAVRGVHALSDLGSCADMRALQDLKAPALDTRTRRAVVPLQARLEEQHILLKTGGALDVERVDRLVAEAGRLGYQPLIMRAHEVRAEIRNDRGLPGATADLESALRAAVGSADRYGQVRIFALLAETIGLTEGRYADARLWRDLAEAGLAALDPGHEELEIRVQRSLGAVALAERAPQEARRRYGRALVLAEGLWGKESTRLPEILNNLALADSAGERKILWRAVAILERAYGPDNPLLMSPLTNLAGSLAASGSYRQALGITRRTLRIQDAHYGPDFRDRAYPLFLSAQILIALDEPVEAMALLDRATALVRRGYGDRHPLVGEMWCARADAELAELRTNAAAESVAHCRALVSGTLPPSHPVHITLLRLEGEAALAQGQADRARSILAEAAAMPGAQKLETMQILAPQAEAELAAGDLTAARQTAEAGLALRNQDSDPALTGRLRLALARAVSRTEPDRVSGLARQALSDLLRSGSPRTRALRAQAKSRLEI